MSLKIYGTPASRTSRVIWLAYELGIEFDNDPINPRKGETRTPEYLAINPNAHVPTMKDGDLVLWESLAINLYLAKKHASEISPKNPEEDALATQWSMWGLNEIEPYSIFLIQNSRKPEEQQDRSRAADSSEILKSPMQVLDNILADQEWLMGGRFTVADLNVASVMGPLRPVKFDFEPFPNVAKWFLACSSRPAAVKARELQMAQVD